MRQNNTFCLNKADACVLSEESYCYNERNELTERKRLSVLTNYLYDANGSLIREKEGEKETGYRYDEEGLRAGLIENGKNTTFLFYNGESLATGRLKI